MLAGSVGEMVFVGVGWVGMLTEEVNDGEEDGVESCEEEVCSPGDVLDEHGCDLTEVY